MHYFPSPTEAHAWKLNSILKQIKLNIIKLVYLFTNPTYNFTWTFFEILYKVSYSMSCKKVVKFKKRLGTK